MKTNRFVVHAACFLFLFLLQSSLFAQGKKPVATTATQSAATAAYTYKIIDAATGTFGYDVYADGKLRIHQPTVPALPGGEGFKTKAGAEKVAQLVIKKIKRGEMPPTLSVDEMKKLKAI